MPETTDPMTPRVKVHEDKRIAVWLDPNRWEVVHPGGCLGTRTDAYVSGPGWRDAAVTPLVEPSRFKTPDGSLRWVVERPGWESYYVYGGGTDGPEILRRIAAAYLSAAAWAERQAEHAPGEPPIDRPAPYRHYGGQPCYGCQICLDDGEATDG